MKATELKIGDWVDYKGEAVQIHEFLEDVVWFLDGSVSALMEDIKPVPFTKEILEKNGGSKLKNGYTIGIDGIKFIITQFEKSVWTIYLIYGISFIPLKEFTHVHQLQHLLWALGINDDLKI